MIIDTYSYPAINGRKFYGLKKNGKYFFKDSNNLETPNLDLTIRDGEDKKRIEGESFFIIFDKNNYTDYKEYLIGISKKGKSANCNIEIYDFDNRTIKKKMATDIFGDISSESFSILKYFNDTDSHFYYIFSYIKTENKFIIMKAHFNLTNDDFYVYHNVLLDVSCSNKRIVSCFFTEKLKYICFYQKENREYIIIVFDRMFANYKTTKISEETSNEKQLIFIKGIHLKKEIGVFMYYKNKNDLYPIITLKECNSTNDIISYSSFSEIQLNKVNCNYRILLNDLIKINDNKICFICSSNDKKSLNIVPSSCFFSPNDCYPFTIFIFLYFKLELFQFKYQFRNLQFIYSSM